MTKNPANILIVDDIEANRDALRSLIKAFGHTPILAEDGLMALEKLKEQAVDLVLLDIMMPEIDGYEVLSHIKDDATLRHIPVIMITALDEVDSALNCIKMGADDYLPKPIKIILLKARVQGCLEKKFWRDKEEDYRRQIEEANLKLEERVREKTQALEAASKRLQVLDKAKGDALKLIYYACQGSLQDLFKKSAKAPIEEAKELMDTIKQSFQLSKIDPTKRFLPFELNTIHELLNGAIESVRLFAKSRQVLMKPLLYCGEQKLKPELLGMLVSESADEWDNEISLSQSALACKKLTGEGKNQMQKELGASALAELLKTAVKFSRLGSTITFSCELLDNGVMIGIHATGRIISEEEFPHFFEIPSNLHRVTMGRHPGIGPSTAQNIIHLLDGSVTVENRESEGISFFVALGRKNLGSVPEE
jgi:two-component system sensor histidine kinase/response regulator